VIRPTGIARTLRALAASVAIAGCGGKAAPPPTAPPVATGVDDRHGHHDHHDHDHDGAVDEASAADDHDHHHLDPPPTDPAPPAPPDAAQVKADLVAAETAAYQAAQPVFTTYCAACHQQGGKKATAKKLGHFDMTAYPFGGHHAAQIGGVVREVLGVDGGRPTMPKDKPGAVRGDELALIVAWTAAWAAAEAGGAHPAQPHHGH